LAPVAATPQKPKTGVWGNAYPNPGEEDGRPRDLYFSISSPRRLCRVPDRPRPQQLYVRFYRNFYQSYVLAVLIWADLLLLFVNHPCHTVYYFSRDAIKDILFYFLRKVFYTYWHGSRRKEGG
jgi:hypothetical protein